MGLEVVLIVVGVTLLGGMFIAVALACEESPRFDDSEDLDVPRAKLVAEETAGFYADPSADPPAASDDRTVLYIEHYLRRERLRAQRFADQPSTESLLSDYESVWSKDASS